MFVLKAQKCACPSGSAAMALDFYCLRVLCVCIFFFLHTCAQMSAQQLCKAPVFQCKFYSKSPGFITGDFHAVTDGRCRFILVQQHGRI